jgi:hypothetical protein
MLALRKKVFGDRAKGARAARRAKPARTRLSLETLEDRVTPSVQLIGNAVFVTGDNGGAPVNDQTTIDRNASNGVMINFNGQVFNFAPGQVSTIEVDPEMGSNTTTVNATPAGVRVDVECLQGPDTVTVGNGNLDNLGGNVFVNGDGGANLFVNDQAAPVGRVYTNNNQSFSWSGSANLTYQSLHEFQINGGPKGNIFNIDTPAVAGLYGVTGITPGLGHNTINVGEGVLNATGGQVGVSSNGGADTVVLQDASQASAEDYTITNASVNREGRYVLTYSAISALTIEGAGSASATSTYTFNSTEYHTAYTINASAGNNLFFLSSLDTSVLSAPLTLNGSPGGDNQLNGPDAGPPATTWDITGAGSGKLDTQVSFTAMRDLIGGSGENVFTLAPGGSIPGTIIGGSGVNVLDYKPLTGPVHVNLQTQAASNLNGGAAGGFRNIGEFIGSASAADTLIGPNLNTTWTISGANSGSVTTSATRFAFFGFENLMGGSGVDTFRFLNSGSLAGTLNGGGAPLHEGNWLDYSALTTPVAVNLQTGSATNVHSGAAGAVTNIQNVIGSASGANNLTGDSQGNILIGGSGVNTLTGGSGSSLLIGGSGHGTITGGSSTDILIAGTTTNNASTTAGQDSLMAILAELQSADSFADKVYDLIHGANVGDPAPHGHDLNGSNKLTWGGTVRASSGSFTLSGDTSASLAADWFFSNAFSAVKDFNDDGVKDEHNNNAIGVL